MTRAFCVAALAAASVPATWLSPLEGQLSFARDPIVGIWKVTLPQDGLYRVLADGIWAADPSEMGLFHFNSGGEMTESGGIVRAPRVEEGHEFVIGTRVYDKTANCIALDRSEKITEGSQPRLAAVPLQLGAQLGL